jgi:hypothetical protein
MIRNILKFWAPVLWNILYSAATNIRCHRQYSSRRGHNGNRSFLRTLTLRKQCSIKNFFLLLIRLQFLVCLASSPNAELDKLKVLTKQGISCVRQYWSCKPLLMKQVRLWVFVMTVESTLEEWYMSQLRGCIWSTGQPSKQPAGPSTAIRAIYCSWFAEMQWINFTIASPSGRAVYIYTMYGAPILDVSRSHTTHHSR